LARYAAWARLRQDTITQTLMIVVDYHRIEGKSTDWVVRHFRAGLDVVEKEITSSGFKRIAELEDVLKEYYLVEFEKVSEGDRKSDM
jgi:hypothetical protein